MLRQSSSAEPLYLQVKKDILSRIEREVWKVGENIPTEDELTELYGVGRVTVREALKQLSQEGYLRRYPKRGTVVLRKTPAVAKFGKIKSFNAQLSDAQITPSTVLLSKGMIKASDARRTRVMEGFELEPDADVIEICRLKKGNNVPFAIQTVYVLPELCPDILEQDLLHLFELYEKRYGRQIVEADELIRVGNATVEEARLLEIEEGTAVVVRDRISYDQTGQVFEVLHSIDRADKFEYRYIIRRSERGVTKQPSGA